LLYVVGDHVVPRAPAGDVYVIGNQGQGIYNVLGPGAGTLAPAGVLRWKIKAADDFLAAEENVYT
jgi:hypothetical protein